MGDLDDTALDEYLDFCQKVLVDPNRDGGWFHEAHDERDTQCTWSEHRVIDNYFPLANGTAYLMQDERPGLRGRGLPPTKKNDGDMDILEPGEMYTIYDAKDVLGNLSGDLKMIVEKSARWVGIDCDFVCGLVERYERRLVRWWNDRRHGRNGEGEIRAEEGVSGGTLTPGG